MDARVENLGITWKKELTGVIKPLLITFKLTLSELLYNIDIFFLTIKCISYVFHICFSN